jgi:hypothetical protein
MQAQVVNTSFTALRGWPRRTAYLHERTASNRDMPEFSIGRAA